MVCFVFYKVSSKTPWIEFQSFAKRPAPRRFRSRLAIIRPEPRLSISQNRFELSGASRACPRFSDARWVPFLDGTLR
jgi:hypothetical protein